MGTYSKVPVRYPSGVNNTPGGANPNRLWHKLPTLDKTRTAEYHNDFFQYVAGDWTVTDVGVSNTTATDNSGGVGANGVLKIGVGTENPASRCLTQTKLDFYPAARYGLWFEAKLQVDDASLSDVVVGLQNMNTTPLSGVTDGVYFTKAHGAATWAVTQISGSTAATSANVISAAGSNTLTNIGSITAATWQRVGFYYNGKDECQFYVDGLKQLTLNVTNMPTAGLTPVMFVKANSAVARSLSLDYINITQERYFWSDNIGTTTY